MAQSRKTLETNPRRFVKLYWLLGVMLSILVCFLAYLLIRVYNTSSSLAEASRQSFANHSKTHLSILDEYFEKRISDTETLLNSRALHAYYHNKALGMSMEYGLAVAVAEMRDEFERFQRSVRSRDLAVFQQITFIDAKEMRVVAETKSSSNSRWIDIKQLETILKSSEPIPTLGVMETGSDLAIFTFQKFIHKDQVKGYLLMRLDTGTIQAQIERQSTPKSNEFHGVADSRGILVVGPQELLGKTVLELLGVLPSLLEGSPVIETYDHLLEPASKPLLISGGKIPISPFHLVSVAPISKYLGEHSGSLWGMVFAALIGGLAIMAAVIFKGLKEQSKIYGQLEEARDTLDIRVKERTAELAETNSRLQMEIDQRQRTEETQRLLTTAVEQAAEGIMITDGLGNIEYVNPAFEGITGYTKDEAIGQNSRILQSGHHDQAFYRELWGTIENGEAWKGQLVNRKKDGTLYREDAVISPVKDRTGRIVNYVAVKRDRTVEIELQQQLFWAQKMEGIGTLAGGIAHDFNNLLQVVLGRSEIMLKRKKEGEADYAGIQQIYQAGKRGADLVKSLLTFSRKVEPRLCPLNLNQEILQFQALISRTIPKTIKIDLHLNGDLESAQADSSQVGQILMNLAVNARDAMPNGGTLTITTNNVELDQEYCRRNLGAKAGRYVLLAVSDTGHGMDKETLAHIFEPFFTTKEAGKGTGLGLATVYGIVKLHQGYIVCYSEPEMGTSFKIYLPAVSSANDLESPSTETDISGGTETILLADDDNSVLDLTKELLESYGYDVITAVNGKEALKIFQSRGDSISLVILDSIMPEIDGKRCSAEILRLNPQAKILIASGYLANGPSEGVPACNVKGFVEKPYNTSQFLKMVREVLDESTHGQTAKNNQ
jgi:PAS domain S-box-containing protein